MPAKTSIDKVRARCRRLARATAQAQVVRANALGHYREALATLPDGPALDRLVTAYDAADAEARERSRQSLACLAALADLERRAQYEEGHGQ